MTKRMTRWMTLILAVMVPLPTVGCQQKEKVKVDEKGPNVQVEAGGTKVKVEGGQEAK